MPKKPRRTHEYFEKKTPESLHAEVWQRIEARKIFDSTLVAYIARSKPKSVFEIGPIVHVKQRINACHVVSALQMTLLSPYISPIVSDLLKNIDQKKAERLKKLGINLKILYDIDAALSDPSPEKFNRIQDAVARLHQLHTVYFGKVSIGNYDEVGKTLFNAARLIAFAQLIAGPGGSISPLVGRMGSSSSSYYLGSFHIPYKFSMFSEGFPKSPGDMPNLFFDSKPLFRTAGVIKIGDVTYRLAQFCLYKEKPEHFIVYHLKKPGKKSKSSIKELLSLNSLHQTQSDVQSLSFKLNKLSFTSTQYTNMLTDPMYVQCISMYVNPKAYPESPFGEWEKLPTYTEQMYFADELRSVWWNLGRIEGFFHDFGRSTTIQRPCPYGHVALRELLARISPKHWDGMAALIAEDECEVERPTDWVFQKRHGVVQIVSTMRRFLYARAPSTSWEKPEWSFVYSGYERKGELRDTYDHLWESSGFDFKIDNLRLVKFEDKKIDLFRMTLFCPAIIAMLWNEAPTKVWMRVHNFLQALWEKSFVTTEEMRVLVQMLPGDPLTAAQDYIISFLKPGPLMKLLYQPDVYPAKDPETIVFPRNINLKDFFASTGRSGMAFVAFTSELAALDEESSKKIKMWKLTFYLSEEGFSLSQSPFRSPPQNSLLFFISNSVRFIVNGKDINPLHLNPKELFLK